MTILTQIFPDAYWSNNGGYYNYGWTPVDPFRFNRWSDSTWSSFFGEDLRHYSRGNGVSIPIGINNNYGNSSFQNYIDLSDFESDSESENDDLNYNSLPMKRKRRLERTQKPSSSTEYGKSEDLPSPTKQKNTYDFDIDLISDANTTDSKRYSTRSIDSKKEVVFVDDDDECEINEITSYEVYKHLKTLLQKSGRCIDEMKGDGNCFFRALSKVVYGSQKFYNEIRQAVVDLIAKFPKKFEALTDGPVSSHIRTMRLDKTWATQTEIYAAATLLGRSFYILSPDQTGDNYKWLLFSPLFQYNSGTVDDPCHITICHTHGNHYDRIAPLKGKCNCNLDPPELLGIKDSLDLTTDENEIV